MTKEQLSIVEMVTSPVSAVELKERLRMSCNAQTVARALNAGCQDLVLTRQWRGGERHGCYEYTRRTQSC